MKMFAVSVIIIAMPHRTLADFLEELGRAGELAPVDAEVDPRAEVAEITRRVARKAGPALLFRCVKGHEIPLLTNLLGAESRICRAMGVETIEEAIGRTDRMLNSSGPEGWLERLRFGAKAVAVASFAANRVKSGACQQVIRLGGDIDLEELPFLLMGWEAERPTLSSATILSALPDSHAQVFLPGDVQVAGRDRLVAVWTEIETALPLIHEYAARQAKMPVAIVLGGDPAVHLAAAAPLPSAVDPLGLAGLLREKPLDAVACRSIDLWAPAESDIVIEGHIDPADAAPVPAPAACGQIVAENRHSRPRFAPTDRIIGHQKAAFRRGESWAIHVTAVTHRANRVFPAVQPLSLRHAAGIDGNENCILHRAMARIFLPFLRTRIPEMVDFDLPLSGAARHLAILAIRKTYPGQAHQVATAAWSMRPFSFARLLVVVDAGVNVRDAEEVWAAIAHEANVERDIWLHAAPPDPLDPTSDGDELGRRLDIDATRKFASEESPGVTRNVLLERDIENLVTDRWAQYGLGPEPNDAT
jgi:4-hydroxy-3-polyprenylbenzoate decarboxylase